MNRPITWLDQINIVSGNLEASLAFYRRLGVEIPEEHVWSTASGIHHASAGETENPAINFELDSIAFAQIWNKGWKGHRDRGGRVRCRFQIIITRRGRRRIRRSDRRRLHWAPGAL